MSFSENAIPSSVLEDLAKEAALQMPGQFWQWGVVGWVSDSLWLTITTEDAEFVYYRSKQVNVTDGPIKLGDRTIDEFVRKPQPPEGA